MKIPGSVFGAVTGGGTTPTGKAALAAHAALLDAARDLARRRRAYQRARRPSDAGLQQAVDTVALLALAFSLAEARHVRALARYHRRSR